MVVKISKKEAEEKLSKSEVEGDKINEMITVVENDFDSLYYRLGELSAQKYTDVKTHSFVKNNERNNESDDRSHVLVFYEQVNSDMETPTGSRDPRTTSSEEILETDSRETIKTENETVEPVTIVRKVIASISSIDDFISRSRGSAQSQVRNAAAQIPKFISIASKPNKEVRNRTASVKTPTGARNRKQNSSALQMKTEGKKLDNFKSGGSSMSKDNRFCMYEKSGVINKKNKKISKTLSFRESSQGIGQQNKNSKNNDIANQCVPRKKQNKPKGNVSTENNVNFIDKKIKFKWESKNSKPLPIRKKLVKHKDILLQKYFPKKEKKVNSENKLSIKYLSTKHQEILDILNKAECWDSSDTDDFTKIYLIETLKNT